MKKLEQFSEILIQIKLEMVRSSLPEHARLTVNYVALPSATPWLPETFSTALINNPSPSISFSSEDRLATTELTAVLAAHLLDLYQFLPQSWLPLTVRGKVALQFEAVGRRLSSLPPQIEVGLLA